MPISEHIIRFLYAFPQHVASRAPSGIVSYTTMSGGLIHIIGAIQIRYPDFKLKTGEVKQITAVFDQLIAQGVLTKDLSRELNWLGSRLIFFLARAVVENAITAGCRNWDAVLQGLLSMSLLASTGSRAGDIARTFSHSEVACLKYEDVTIKLIEKDGTEIVQMVVALKYTKGNK
jgi:hypothetical protein